MSVNLSNTTPAPPVNAVAVQFQSDTSNPPNVSANIPSGQGGVPNIPTQINATGLAANYNAGSAATVYTPTVATVLRITAAMGAAVAATAGTLPSLTIGWTDASGIARTLILLASTSTSATSTYVQGSALIYTNTSTPVTITSASYAAGSGTALSYNLAVTAEVV